MSGYGNPNTPLETPPLVLETLKKGVREALQLKTAPVATERTV